MGLKETQAQWEKMAQEDALYGVLSHPDKRGGKWDLEEFLATGQAEIKERLDWAQQQGAQIKFGRALDFGCGVGRLTQALASRFEKAVGVDVSPTMIQKAQSINRQGEHCEYRLNEAPDLALFGVAGFDFVYSNIVLQHLPVELALKYVAEFARLLKPGATALFFYPERGQDAPWRKHLKALTPGFLLRLYRRARYGASGLNQVEVEMNGAPAGRVLQAFAAGGGEILKSESGWYLGGKKA